MVAQWLKALVNFNDLRPKAPRPVATVGQYIGPLTVRKHCWEAVGDLRDQFRDILLEEITKYLQEFFGPVLSEDRLTVSLYMIGRSPEAATPTIVFISESSSYRKDARKAIQASDILQRYPMFKTAHISRDPGFQRLEQLASEPNNNKTKNHEGNSRLSTDVLFDNSQPLQTLGLPIYIRHSTSLRMATANAVRVGNSICFQTVQHAFVEKSPSSQESSLPLDDDFEIDPDSDSEMGSDDDANIAMTSIGSRSPDVWVDEDESHSGSSRRSSIFSGQSTPKSNGEPGNMDPAASGFEEANSKLNHFIPAKSEFPSGIIPDMPPENTLVVLGRLMKWSEKNDWALVEILNTDVEAALDSSLPRDITPISAFEKSSSCLGDGADIYTVTASGGVLNGVLSGTPSRTRLPNNAYFQDVYTVRLKGSLSNGDCGSVIVDSHTGITYGHIIAGCRTTSFAYVLAAHHVLNDWKTLKPAQFPNKVVPPIPEKTLPTVRSKIPAYSTTIGPVGKCKLFQPSRVQWRCKTLPSTTCTNFGILVFVIVAAILGSTTSKSETSSYVHDLLFPWLSTILMCYGIILVFHNISEISDIHWSARIDLICAAMKIAILIGLQILAIALAVSRSSSLLRNILPAQSSEVTWTTFGITLATTYDLAIRLSKIPQQECGILGFGLIECLKPYLLYIICETLEVYLRGPCRFDSPAIWTFPLYLLLAKALIRFIMVLPTLCELFFGTVFGTEKMLWRLLRMSVWKPRDISIGEDFFAIRDSPYHCRAWCWARLWLWGCILLVLIALPNTLPSYRESMINQQSRALNLAHSMQPASIIGFLALGFAFDYDVIQARFFHRIGSGYEFCVLLSSVVITGLKFASEAIQNYSIDESFDGALSYLTFSTMSAFYHILVCLWPSKENTIGISRRLLLFGALLLQSLYFPLQTTSRIGDSYSGHIEKLFSYDLIKIFYIHAGCSTVGLLYRCYTNFRSKTPSQNSQSDLARLKSRWTLTSQLVFIMDIFLAWVPLIICLYNFGFLSLDSIRGSIGSLRIRPSSIIPFAFSVAMGILTLLLHLKARPLLFTQAPLLRSAHHTLWGMNHEIIGLPEADEQDARLILRAMQRFRKDCFIVAYVHTEWTSDDYKINMRRHQRFEPPSRPGGGGVALFLVILQILFIAIRNESDRNVLSELTTTATSWENQIEKVQILLDGAFMVATILAPVFVTFSSTFICFLIATKQIFPLLRFMSGPRFVLFHTVINILFISTSLFSLHRRWIPHNLRDLRCLFEVGCFVISSTYLVIRYIPRTLPLKPRYGVVVNLCLSTTGCIIFSVVLASPKRGSLLNPQEWSLLWSLSAVLNVFAFLYLWPGTPRWLVKKKFYWTALWCLYWPWRDRAQACSNLLRIYTDLRKEETCSTQVEDSQRYGDAVDNQSMEANSIGESQSDHSIAKPDSGAKRVTKAEVTKGIDAFLSEEVVWTRYDSHIGTAELLQLIQTTQKAVALLCAETWIQENPTGYLFEEILQLKRTLDELSAVISREGLKLDTEIERTFDSCRALMVKIDQHLNKLCNGRYAGSRWKTWVLRALPEPIRDTLSKYGICSFSGNAHQYLAILNRLSQLWGLAYKTGDTSSKEDEGQNEVQGVHLQALWSLVSLVLLIMFFIYLLHY